MSGRKQIDYNYHMRALLIIWCVMGFACIGALAVMVWLDGKL